MFDGAMPAASLLDVPNFPDGCYAETDSQFQFLEQPCATVAVAGEQTLSDTAGMSLIRYEPFTSAATWSGNLTELVIGADPADATNRVILMQEQGDASLFKDIDWPAEAVEITFDYMFREPRGGEDLTVYVDNQIVYYDNAEITLARDNLTSSGAIFVGNVAGRTARLNFVLHSDQPKGGSFGGGLVIDNIRVYALLEHDVDGDGDRDLSDFAVFQRCFAADPLPNECFAFDVDADGTIGMADYVGDIADPPVFKGFVILLNGPSTAGIP